MRYICSLKVRSYYNVFCEITIRTIAIKARNRPAKFILLSFSLKTKIPTKLPSTITPIFIPAKTVEGFSAKALCAFR